MNKLTIIGGNFDYNNGRQSKIIDAIFDCLNQYKTTFDIQCFNGGSIEQLTDIYNTKLLDSNVIFWCPNVSNDCEKLRDIKQKYPQCLFISTKNNYDKHYSDQQLIAHALQLKSNLLVEFTKPNDLFNIRLIDPLNNVWYNGVDIQQFVNSLVKTINHLLSTSRQGTNKSDSEFSKDLININMNDQFIEYVKNTAKQFTNIIQPANDCRFLGNCSFRCMYGFPSFNINPDIILMSPRNFNKESIRFEDMVPIDFKYYKQTNIIQYFGDKKPSVDTPIQLALYHKFPNLKWLIHGHVFIEGKKTTNIYYPCGDLREINEISSIIDCNQEIDAINLNGHGCLIYGTTFDKFVEFEFKVKEQGSI